MALATTIAGGTALAAYLDAKYHIRKDVAALSRLKGTEKELQAAIARGDISLYRKFLNQVDSFPKNHRCLWSRTGEYTWVETRDWSYRYAKFFLGMGVARPELVAFYLQNSDHFIFATLGTWACATAPAMINYNLSGEALIHCLKLASAKVILVDEDAECRQRVEESRDRIENELGMKIVILDAAMRAQIGSLPAIKPDMSLQRQLKPLDPAMLIYTSGTTGLPKACPFQIARLYATTGPRVEAIGIKVGPGGGTWYNPMPLYHGTGANVMNLCLMSGIQLAVGKRFRVSTFWDEIRDSNSTAFVYVGETARYLLAAPPSPRDKDHQVTMMFGNGMRPDVWERFKDRFGVEQVAEFFNSTEGVFALINICRGPFLSTAVGHHGAILRHLMRDVYVPVQVDTDTGDIVRDPVTGFGTRKSYEEGGEMLVRVDNEAVFAGYWNNPSASKKRFAHSVFKKGDLYYRSGDSLRRDDDGRWYFLDRLGDTFRWKSENVSTAEVAIALGQYPGINEANVYGVLVPSHDGRAGCAALNVAPEAKENLNYNSLLAHLRQRLPKYAIPVFLRLVDDQAHTSHNQKQNKVPLRNEGIDINKIKSGTGPNDRFMWLKPGADAYVEYQPQDWDALVAGSSKL